MSHKDYRMIADAVREARRYFQDDDSATAIAWALFSEELLEVLKRDNPRFSEKEFWGYVER